MTSTGRPRFVWVVSTYWVLGSLYVLWTYSAVLRGLKTVPALRDTHVIAVVAILILALAGAIALLLLKQVAFFLFLSTIVLITVLDLNLILTTDWLRVLGPTGQINVAITHILYFGTTAYTWRLLQKGTLR